jgi:flagellar hook-associated protein 2
MAMTIDGLVTGMGTGDMITQLMQVEAIPQTALKNKVTAQTKAVAAYQGINTKLAALTTAAKAMSSTESWGAMKATSTSDAAIVTAKAGAAAGSMTFTVSQLAAAHTVTYDAPVGSLTAPVVAPGGTFKVMLEVGGEADVPAGDGSLASVVKAINETAGAAYKAAAVQVAPGQYTLQLTATATGGATRFASVGVPPAGIDLGNGDVTTLGRNAKLLVGDVGIGYPVESATNTFADVLPGVTINVTKTTDTPVTVSMAADRDGMADKAQALVDAANAALKEIRTVTAAKSGTTAAGALAGDSTLRAITQEILSAVATGAGSAGSLSVIGIKLERGGTLAFDKQKFQDAYAANPADTQKYFDTFTDRTDVPEAKDDVFEPGWDTAGGLARKLEAIGLKATDGFVPPNAPGAAREGVITGMIQRRNDSIRALNDQVTSWDTRLATRKSALQRQYAALEVTLGKMQQQSSWLGSQLAGLS